MVWNQVCIIYKLHLFFGHHLHVKHIQQIEIIRVKFLQAYAELYNFYKEKKGEELEEISIHLCAYWETDTVLVLYIN